MPDFQIESYGRFSTFGVVEANIEGTILTASGTANTKGAYTEVVSAANNVDGCSDLSIYFDGVSEATMRSMLLDIAVGGAGSEQVIIENIFLASRLIQNPNLIKLPISITPGVRVSARMQSSVASSQGVIHVIMGCSNFTTQTPLSKTKAYGVDLATSKGVNVTGGTSYGAWTEITPSLDEDIKGFFVCVSRDVDGWSGSEAFYDVGIGGAGSEQIVLEKQMMSQNSNETGTMLFSPFYGIKIPAGTRIAIRALTNGNPDFDMDYTFNGVY